MEKQYETHVLNNCFPTAIFAISILKPFPFPQNQSKEEMNWRNKNPSSSSSSQSGLASISQALFPISWLSKFKQITRKSNSSPAKTKRKSIPNSPLNPSLPPNTPKQCKNTPTVSNSVIHDTQDKLEFEFPFSSCRSYRSCARKVTTKDDPKFRDMVSDLKQMRILTDKVGEESKENALETPRRRMKKVRKATSRKSTERDERILQELVEKNILYLQAIEAIRTPENDLEARKSKYVSSSSVEKDRSGTKQLNEVKTSNSEKQRKSVYVSREQQQQQHKRRVKQSCKVKVCSPRTASKMEICKIKAMEEMKKAKARKKTRIVEERKPLESFAVVKSSLDPEKDFRDSMVEMIKENMISKAKELEDLLACYLSLNSNEYHDLIVKVFQEVWIDMYQVCSGSELQKDENRICDY